MRNNVSNEHRAGARTLDNRVTRTVDLIVSDRTLMLKKDLDKMSALCQGFEEFVITNFPYPAIKIKTYLNTGGEGGGREKV